MMKGAFVEPIGAMPSLQMTSPKAARDLTSLGLWNNL